MKSIFNVLEGAGTLYINILIEDIKDLSCEEIEM
jgi:hypothetical protein